MLGGQGRASMSPASRGLGSQSSSYEREFLPQCEHRQVRKAGLVAGGSAPWRSVLLLFPALRPPLCGGEQWCWPGPRILGELRLPPDPGSEDGACFHEALATLFLQFVLPLWVLTVV